LIALIYQCSPRLSESDQIITSRRLLFAWWL